jgi:HPt (histidine-containing phosphotransfer) domain-containing protein
VSTLVSYSYIEEISGGDKDFQREIVNTFLEEIVGEMEKIRIAVQEENWSTLGSLAHKIKAPIGMLCTEPMKELILRVEKDAKHGERLSELPEQVNLLLANLDLVNAQLKADLQS